MSRDYEAEFEAAFVGRQCRIEREKPFWRANFGGGFTMGLRVPWRIVANGRVAFGNEDDGQLFGLPSPVDGEERCATLLTGRKVEAVHLDCETGDLRVVFDDNVRIDVFNQSAGYEGWDAFYSTGADNMSLVAMGGGETTVFPIDSLPETTGE